MFRPCNHAPLLFLLRNYQSNKADQTNRLRPLQNNRNVLMQDLMEWSAPLPKRLQMSHDVCCEQPSKESEANHG